MPKPHTFPTLYDNLNKITITFLNRYGYLKPNQWQSGTISWTRNGNKIGSISIRVNTQPESPYLELDYKCNEAPINYIVQLVSVPSNIGKGVVWYFVCPLTGKRCRKLYLHEGYFYHRSAFRGCMYEKQTYSKLGNALGAYFAVDNLHEQLRKKHFKKTYAGKPTKRYLKLTHQIKRAENSITWS
jgi:hypothetical protein